MLPFLDWPQESVDRFRDLLREVIREELYPQPAAVSSADRLITLAKHNPTQAIAEAKRMAKLGRGK